MQYAKALIILLCSIGFGLVIYTHYYRPPFDEQLPFYTQPDASPAEIAEFIGNLPPHDSFDLELYHSIRSVKDAVSYIRENYPDAPEPELARAVFDLTRRRFLHYMYPRHTYLTNPFLAFLDTLVPNRTFNAMYLADDLLRQAAGASCGQAAAVFMEIWRELGGRARAYHLRGHDVAEAMVGGKLWMVDPDLEGIAPYGMKEIRSNPDLIEDVYSHIEDPKRIHKLKKIFMHPDYWHYGFDDPPSTSPRIYKGQQAVNILKFVFFPLLAAVLLLILRLRDKKKRS